MQKQLQTFYYFRLISPKILKNIPDVVKSVIDFQQTQ